MVEPVLRPLVPFEKLLQLAAGPRWNRELLDPDRAVRPAIQLQVRLRGKALHPVPHAALSKAEEEVLLPEIEEAVVVRLIGTVDRVVNPDRVV